MRRLEPAASNWFSLYAISTAQGVGASLSTTVACLIVANAGYSAAFWTLAAIALAAFALLLLAMQKPEGQGQAGTDAGDHGQRGGKLGLSEGK